MASKIYLSELPVEESAAAPVESVAVRPSRISLSIVVIRDFIADAFTCTAVMLFSLSLRLGHNQPLLSSIQRPWLFSAAAGLCATLLLYYGESKNTWSPTYSLGRTASSVRTCALNLMLLLCGSVFLRSDFPTIAAVIALSILPVALAIQRHLLGESLNFTTDVIEREGIAGQSDACDLESLLRVSSQDELDREGFPRAKLSLYTAVGKRLLDVAISSILLITLAPLLLLIAVLIRVNSKGPALFVQERVGIRGTLFRMYKFRSMSCDSDTYQRSPQSSNDPRITAVGRVLRRTSLDELPQLLNVLRGHMSLVGPRPEMPFIVDSYDDIQRQRLRVMPGITGLWQLSRDRAFPIHENLHHDLSYIRRRSLSMDMAILIHTLLFAMRGGI